VPVLAYSIIVLGAYLLGSLPTGFLVARAKGVDIRTVGSKNMGATNVFRILGKRPGTFVLLVDILKGWGAVALARYFVRHVIVLEDCDCVWLNQAAAPILAGLGAILGHNYTCWLGFKGGKGIATSGGVLIGLVPWAFLVSLVTWIGCFLVTRFVSVASIVAAAVLPFATWLTTHDLILTAVTSAMAALAIYKHKANIQRLLIGTENRFDFKKKDTAP
jgi:acyl phosphate:glycerol-3-phosphate acyltransferase